MCAVEAATGYASAATAIVGRDELLAPEKLNTVESTWLSTIVCPARAIIIASRAIALPFAATSTVDGFADGAREGAASLRR